MAFNDTYITLCKNSHVYHQLTEPQRWTTHNLSKYKGLCPSHGPTKISLNRVLPEKLHLERRPFIKVVEEACNWKPELMPSKPSLLTSMEAKVGGKPYPSGWPQGLDFHFQKRPSASSSSSSFPQSPSYSGDDYTQKCVQCKLLPIVREQLVYCKRAHSTCLNCIGQAAVWKCTAC